VPPTPKLIVLALNPELAYSREIVRGVGRFLTECTGYEGALMAPSNESAMYGMLRNAAGVIGMHLSNTYLEILRERQVPAVEVSAARETRDQPRVLPDNVAIGRMAADHLVEAGYKRFFFTGIPNHWYSRERFAGYFAQLTTHGFDCHDAPHDPHVFDEWLPAQPRPFAIFCANDIRAYRVVHSARMIALRVPQDVAILGVDNDELMDEFMPPRISSIDANSVRIGYEAMRLLDGLIRGEPAPQHILRVPPIGVIARQSTDFLQIEDEAVQQAVRYIRDHCGRKIGIADVVDHVCVSRRWLERRFIEVLKRAPAQVLREARVDRARSLLLSSDLSISEIAQKSGFSSPKQLGETFSNVAGESPREFRQRLRQKA